MAASSTARHLLRIHFLRRLLDNDLMSPNADRRETLVLLATSLAVSGLVITVILLGQKYVIGIPTPALTSVAALDDKFLYISASMLVMALMAAVQWDALALDQRDTAILGPLPVSPRDIGRAQLAALTMFVAAFAVVLNAVPSVVFPLLTVSHFHVSIFAVIRMVAMHATVTMAAGAYGFLTVLVLRELLRVLLPQRWFRHVSAAIQAVLITALGTSLLLLPALASSVPAKWLTGRSALRTVPPGWFLGLHEAGTAQVTLDIRNLGLRIPAALVVPERNARLLYDALLPTFPGLAQMAISTFSVTFVLAIALYIWNNRRLPLPRASRPRGPNGMRRDILHRVVETVVPKPLARAGFFFTLQTLARSVPHRISIAGTVAVAIAAGIVLMQGIRAVSGPAAAPARLLALQTVVITIVLAGVRQSLAMPAELRANWMFSMAWNGEVTPFVRGVKCAVIAAVVVPVLLALFGVHAYLLGTVPALQHGAIGLALSIIVLELVLRPESLPLTCSARPVGNFRTLAPIYLLMLLFTAYNLGRLERWALGDVARFAMVLGTLVLICAGARLYGARRHSQLPSMALDDLPETTTQRLGLSEPV